MKLKPQICWFGFVHVFINHKLIVSDGRDLIDTHKKNTRSDVRRRLRPPDAQVMPAVKEVKRTTCVQ